MWDSLLGYPGPARWRRSLFVLLLSRRQEGDLCNTVAHWVIHKVGLRGSQAGGLREGSFQGLLTRELGFQDFKPVEMKWKTFYIYRLTKAGNTHRNFEVCFKGSVKGNRGTGGCEAETATEAAWLDRISRWETAGSSVPAAACFLRDGLEGPWGWGGQLWDFCEKKMLNQGKGSLPGPLPSAPEMLSVFSGTQEQTGNWESSVNYGRRDRLSVLGGRLTKEHLACVTWILLPTISFRRAGIIHYIGLLLGFL